MATVTIDQILARMEWGHKYHIFNLWNECGGEQGPNGSVPRIQLLHHLLKNGLVDNYAQGTTDAEYSIRLTLLGDKVKHYKGGWEAHQRHQALKGHARTIVFYGTFIFAILAVFVPIYCSDQERKQDEIMNQILLQRIDQANQEKAVDSVLSGQKVTQETLEKILKKDSIQKIRKP